eukprot:Pgem_evm1s5824
MRNKINNEKKGGKGGKDTLLLKEVKSDNESGSGYEDSDEANSDEEGILRCPVCKDIYF